MENGNLSLFLCNTYDRGLYIDVIVLCMAHKCVLEFWTATLDPTWMFGNW